MTDTWNDVIDRANRIAALKAEYNAYFESCGPGMEPDDYIEWLEYRAITMSLGLMTLKQAKVKANEYHEANDTIRCARVGVKGMNGFMICESPSMVYEVLSMVIADGNDQITFTGDMEAIIGITFVDMTTEQLNNLGELDDWM